MIKKSKSETLLLPCPFCGSEAKLTQWKDTLDPNASWVKCTNSDCMVMTESYHDVDSENAKNKAIAAWNRRRNNTL